MKIYCIKNEKLGFFNRPIFAENDAEVKSYILNVLQTDADRALIHLKDDLALYYLGEFDSEIGAIYSVFADFLCTGVQTAVAFEPPKICNLVDLFNMIPEDKVPRSENELRAAIKSIGKSVDVLTESIEFIKGELKLCKKVNRKF